LLALGGLAYGGIVTYEGRDGGAEPGDSRPVADAARDSFLAAIGPAYFTLTFEGLPLGYAATLNFTTFHIDQVGTEATTGLNPNDAGVTSDTTFPSVLGYNTTPGGNTFVRFVPIFDTGTAGASLVFNSPIEFFGAYFTGLGTAAGSLNAKFNNGTTQSLPVVGGPGGGVQFFGFTTFGAPITQLDLVLEGVLGDTRDVYAIDDVITGLQPTFVPGTPEPATLAMVGGAFVVLALLRRRN
jgi:hypothetical protein